MGRKPKYSPSARAAFFAALKEEGATIKYAAEKVNVPVSTAEKWVQAEREKERGARNPSAPEAPSSSSVSPGRVEKPIQGASGGAAAGQGAGGAQAAARAAGVTASAPPESKTQETAPRSDAPKILPVQGLLVASQMLLRGYVEMTATRYEVEMTPELQESAKLSDEECAELGMWAPYMGDEFLAFMERWGKYFGPLAFAFSFYLVASRRAVTIKKHSPIVQEMMEERELKRAETRMKRQRVPGFGAQRAPAAPPVPGPRTAAPPGPGELRVNVADADPRSMPVEPARMSDLEKASADFMTHLKANGPDPSLEAAIRRATGQG